jgi:hypothetical protein
MTGSRNVEANWQNLKSLDVAGGRSADGAGRSREVECRRDTGEEGGRHAGHLIPQFLIVIWKNCIGNISRMDLRLRAREREITWKNKTMQKIIMTMK